MKITTFFALVGLVISQIQTPTTQCSKVPLTPLSISGSCSFLNGLPDNQGCCTGDEIIPSTFSSCSTSCQAIFLSYWCSLTCLPGATQRTSGSSIVLCTSATDRLWETCSSCSAFGFLGIQQWLSYAGFVNSTQNCYDFTGNLPAVSSVASLVNITIPNSRLNATAGIANVTVKAYVTSTGILLNSSINVVSPSGNTIETLNLVPKLLNRASNLWVAEATYNVSSFSPNGTWTLDTFSAINSQGTSTRSGTLGLFYVLTSSSSSITSVSVCKGGNTLSDIFDVTAQTAAAVTTCNTGSGSVTLVGSKSFSTTSLTTDSPVLNIVGPLNVSVLGTWVQSGLNTILLSNSAGFTLSTGAPTQILTGEIALSALDPLATYVISQGATITFQNKLTVNSTLKVYGTLGTLAVHNQTGAFYLDGPAANLNIGGTTFFNSPNVVFSRGVVTGSRPLQIIGQNALILSGAQINASLITPVTPQTTSKFRTQQQTYPVVSTCARPTATTSASFEFGSTLNVLPCDSEGCSCAIVNGLNVSASVYGNFTLASGAKIKLTNVGNSNFGILDVTTTALQASLGIYGFVNLKSGSNILVSIGSQVPDNRTSIPLLRFKGACSANVIANTLTIDPPLVATRNWNQRCDYNTAGGYSVLSLQLGDTVVIGGPQPASYPYTSSQEYFLILQQTCGQFLSADFVSAIVSLGVTNRTSVSSDQVNVTRLQCSSVSVFFQCKSSISSSDADALCSQIVSDARNTNTQLWNRLRASDDGSQPTSSSSSSNSSLYGLFALVLLPVLCVFCGILFIRNRRREADNQYMQDTATFSNVAASPQPLSQPQPYAQPALYAYPPQAHYGHYGQQAIKPF